MQFVPRKSGRNPFDVDSNSSDAEITRAEMHLKMSAAGYKFAKHWSDQHLPVKTFFEQLRKLDVHISSRDDFWQNATAVISKTHAQFRAYSATIGHDFLNAAADMMNVASGTYSQVQALRSASRA